MAIFNKRDKTAQLKKIQLEIQKIEIGLVEKKQAVNRLHFDMDLVSINQFNEIANELQCDLEDITSRLI